MEHLFVSYEIAQQLKEKGFDKQCFAEYRQWDGRAPYLAIYQDCYSEDTFPFTTEALAPLYAQVIDWFREKHNIFVQLRQEFYPAGINYLWQILIYDKNTKDAYGKKSTGLYGDNAEYKTYYEALDAAITKALKLI